MLKHFAFSLKELLVLTFVLMMALSNAEAVENHQSAIESTPESVASDDVHATTSAAAQPASTAQDRAHTTVCSAMTTQRLNNGPLASIGWLMNTVAGQMGCNTAPAL